MSGILETLKFLGSSWLEVAVAVDKRLETQAAEIARLRVAFKWHIERDGDDLLICEGDHDRHEGCIMQRWVKAENVATARLDALALIKQDTDELIEQGRKDGMEYAAQIALQHPESDRGGYSGIMRTAELCTAMEIAATIRAALAGGKKA